MAKDFFQLDNAYPHPYSLLTKRNSVAACPMHDMDVQGAQQGND